jgi:putative ABC transport system permease protein
MRFRDVLWLGFRGLRERRLRAALTILSVLIGVAAILALVSQTTGIQASIVNALQTLGPTSVLVSPRGTPLTQADVARVLTVPGVEAVIPIVTERMATVRAGQTSVITVVGVDREGLGSLLGEIRMVEGTVYSATTVPLAVVGYNVAFPVAQGGQQTLSLGQPLVLEQQLGPHPRRVTVLVTGFLERYGSTPLLPVDDAIFLPLDAAMKLFNRRSFSLLLVRVADVDSVQDVAEALTSMYGNSAQIITIQQITQTVSTIIGQLGILLGSVAAISLSVAGLGIMNIMLVSVFERTREIGILKAIGFKNREILTLFLSEAAIIGVAGGLLGLAAGYGLSEVLPIFFTGLLRPGSQTMRQAQQTGFQGPPISSYTPIITPDIVLAAFAIAVTVSIAAGLYPAWRASRMEPIKALRHE